MSHSNKPFIPLAIAVLTVSDTRSIETDTSGQYLIDALIGAGHTLAERQIVKDDIYQIRAVVSAWIASPNVQTVLITGGTGFSGVIVHPKRLAFYLIKRLMGLVSYSVSFRWRRLVLAPCNHVH